MSSIKIFVIFSVGTLYLAVMSWRVGFDELVSYPTLFEARLKQCGSGIFRVSGDPTKFCVKRIKHFRSDKTQSEEKSERKYFSLWKKHQKNCLRNL